MAKIRSLKMEVEEERCRLQWDNYASDLSLSLWKLRDLPDLCDVTLATNEGTVTAHKIILSACSLQLRGKLIPIPMDRFDILNS